MLEPYGNVNNIVFDDGPDSIDRLISQILFQDKNMNWKKIKHVWQHFHLKIK